MYSSLYGSFLLMEGFPIFYLSNFMLIYWLLWPSNGFSEKARQSIGYYVKLLNSHKFFIKKFEPF
jgi:hypothetical protein